MSDTNKKMLQYVGGFIRHFRKCTGLSQRAFCEQMGGWKVDMSNCENGRKIPGIQFFLRLLRRFPFSTDQMQFLANLYYSIEPLEPYYPSMDLPDDAELRVFGDWMSSLMAERSISFRELAYMTRYDVRSLGTIRAGTGRPSVHCMLSILRALRAEPADLYTLQHKLKRLKDAK